jgi:hypothetical protein
MARTLYSLRRDNNNNKNNKNDSNNNNNNTSTVKRPITIEAINTDNCLHF